MAVQDPFEQTIKKIWSEVIEKNSEITDMVKVGNRAKRWTSEKPRKNRIGSSDAPEIDVFPSSFTRTGRTSSSLMITHGWIIALTTASKDIDKRYTLLIWELLRAFDQAERDSDGQFNLGLDYVQSVEISGVDPSDQDELQQRGASGWTGLLAITVDFAFDLQKHLRDNELE